MKGLGFKIVFILLFTFITGGCVFEKKPSLKKDKTREGDLVTWKITNGLVVQGYLGQRREHIPVQHDSEFYHPDHKRFMGQFPIDYTPRTFDKITAEQVKNLPPPYSDGPLEFNLMLNGSIVTPTDNSVNQTNNGLDHPDQVKVVVDSFGKSISKNDTKASFKQDLSNYLDFATEKRENGLTCYKFKSDLTSEGKRCLGIPISEKAFPFSLTITNKNQPYFLAESHEFIYGGIQVRWYGNTKNLDKAQLINEAIWRLISIWNVA